MNKPKLNADHFTELVALINAKKRSWVFYGPLVEARKRVLKTYPRPNILVDLELNGLIRIIPPEGAESSSLSGRAKIEVTAAGRFAVLLIAESEIGKGYHRTSGVNLTELDSAMLESAQSLIKGD